MRAAVNISWSVVSARILPKLHRHQTILTYFVVRRYQVSLHTSPPVLLVWIKWIGYVKFINGFTCLVDSSQTGGQQCIETSS